MTRTAVELGRRGELSADCFSCFGLCCVALAFSRSADFAIDKPAGDPCVNLDDGHRCTIHSRLRDSGFKGCSVFDCFGAGQKVSQHTFAGVGWRDDHEVRQSMFAVFPLVRRLHELLWYLDAASALAPAPELDAAYARVERTTLLPAAQLTSVDVDALFDSARPLLTRASAAARASHPTVLDKRIRAGAELLGADLRGADLRGTDLRAALLIGADLRGADLRAADLIGADLRDADLRGADLSTAIYLTQMQLNSAGGDATTGVPRTLDVPAHWVSPKPPKARLAA